jgi:hypothetical protein
MWDEPEPRDRQFNRFARREVTKAARAAEYWSSEFDEYALPDSSAGGDTNGFRSARGTMANGHSRMGKPYPTKSGAERPVAPPVIKLEPTKHDLPDPLPFTFNIPRAGPPKADIGGFTETSNSSLALMKSLGVLEDDDVPLIPSGGSSPARASGGLGVRKGGKARMGGGLGGSSPLLGSVSPVVAGIGFEGRGKADVDEWKNLGLDANELGLGLGLGTELSRDGAVGLQRNGVGGDVPLARGTKRLGMGRPAAWGSKKARQD